MIFIRVDANPEIATGHLMRCLAIADAFKKKNMDIRFVMSDDKVKNLLDQWGQELISLNSHWREMVRELPTLIEYINQYKATAIIVDSYSANSLYFKELSKYIKVILFDDLFVDIYECAMLINYNSYACDLDYEKKYLDTKLLLGCKFAPLRKEFQNISFRIINKEVKNILITSGGGNAFGITNAIIDRLLKDNININLIVVAGAFANDDLERKYGKYNDIEICRNVSNMSELMLKSDIAISAGGSTLYELCACGTPTICYCIAENQSRNVKKLNEDGLVLYAGNIVENKDDTLDKISYYIADFVHNKNKRVSISSKMQKSIDGLGSYRILDEIKSILALSKNVKK